MVSYSLRVEKAKLSCLSKKFTNDFNAIVVIDKKDSTLSLFESEILQVSPFSTAGWIFFQTSFAQLCLLSIFQKWVYAICKISWYEYKNFGQ